MTDGDDDRGRRAPNADGRPAEVPVTRPRSAAAGVYDRLAPVYERLADPFERRHRGVGLSLLGATIGERVLSVGPGPGACLPPLADAVGPGGRVVGVDVSAAMCRRSLRTVREAGVADRVGVVRGDAVDLPVRGDAVDAAFCSFTLELFAATEIPSVLAEWRRVLRPGGRVAVVALSRTPPTGLAVRAYELAHVLLPAHLDCRPIYVVDHLRDAGFEVVERVRLSSLGLAVDCVLARPVPEP